MSHDPVLDVQLNKVPTPKITLKTAIAVHDTVTDVYTFTLPHGYTYKINGNFKDLDKSIGYNVDYLCSTVGKPTIEAFRTENIIEYYLRVDGQTTLSVLDYLEQEKKLLCKQKYDEKYACNVWSNLEDEYEYKKFKQSWKAINKHVLISVGMVPIQIQTKVVSTNKWIRPGYSDSSNIFDITCIYDRRLYYETTIKQILLDYKMINEDNKEFASTPEKRYKFYNYSDDKITVFIGKTKHFDWNVRKTGVIGSYQELLDMYDRDVKAIDDTLRGFLIQMESPDSNKDKFLKISSMLDDIKSKLSRVKPMSKSYDEFVGAKAAVTEAIAYLNTTKPVAK